jgi:ubiquinone/menaquinone biosynthesis C-methylase UbiE
MSVAGAFDALATRYDQLWTHTAAGRAQRHVVWKVLEDLFRPGDHILDLGCGTGEDALWLARRRLNVHAVDAAPRMIQQVRERAAAERLSLETTVLPAEELRRLPGDTLFDGALADFGVLNCVEDVRALAMSLARLIRPGGKLVVVPMGRFCLWEALWYLSRLDPKRAFRRLRRGAVPTSLGFAVFYRSVAETARAHQPWFLLERWSGAGLLAPPSYVRLPEATVQGLARVDGWLGRWPLFRALADHRVLVFERTAAESPAGRRLRLLCPVCRQSAQEDVPCPGCGFLMSRQGGFLRALPPQRRAHYARFFEEYGAVRHSEGRGSQDAGYYRALPYKDLSGRNADQWRIRATTYDYFRRHVLSRRPLDILDLGAGNGWLSWRLARLGHRPVAVDVWTDPLDGLGAAARAFEDVPLVEAEFDRLPFEDAQFDLAVFNASLHYSPDYRRTLAEVRRCLRPQGRVVILDSPIYRRPEHGEAMRNERRQQYRQRYGFTSDSLGSLEYLDEPGLTALARELGIRWQIHRPWYGRRWHLRPWKAWLLGRRPPSRFWILVGRFEPS